MRRVTPAPPAERTERVRTALAEIAAGADQQRRRRLQSEVALDCLPVARAIAARYRGRGVDLADLEQVAALGLVKAVRRWRPGRSDDFLQFAVPTISGEIKRYFRDSWWTVRPPRRLQEARAAIAQAEQTLRQQGGPVDDGTVARELELDAETVRQARVAAAAAKPVSLDALDPDDPRSERALGAVDGDLSAVEDRLTVEAMLATLTERERTVIRLRFYARWSQARIGSRIGVSQMQVSRMLRDILGKLRTRSQAPSPAARRRPGAGHPRHRR